MMQRDKGRKENFKGEEGNNFDDWLYIYCYYKIINRAGKCLRKWKGDQREKR